ncbi:class I SAM-dependent methyltransferase [Lysobacter sp. KIS68-7]|uniref:class I SAM-dependent methyltransferase n=1 Tax=Lysobacter sp. KIS68-7 TaxID=2904252 RepID=UPI001E3113D4|nr:class I SAM-dependent methyltransferase [Lysobacter sp. KIS68-7]UHQ20639.1 class I SAM-dependent methyltransferase [Lysobacter sp. KIS68-7]
MTAATLPAGDALRIARAFLPERWYGNRYHYYYTRAKLRSDPLYPGVIDALRGTSQPVLDLGCGIGLLAHALRASGIALPYRGVDNDATKVTQARRAAQRAELHGAAFDVVDLAAGMPSHSGSVTILDVLQFVPPEAQDAILEAATAMIAPGGALVIRTGLDDGSARARTTRGVDALSRIFGWMNAGPKRYPDADALRARFQSAGLRARFDPLFGDTPFNNWRIVATRD